MLAKLQQKPLDYATVGVAARLGDLVAVQEMVWHGRPVDVFDNRGWSAIHEAAYAGHIGCLEFLLRQPGVDPDWVNHAKETALILAARQGKLEAVVALINARADLDLSTNEGYTPLSEALNNNNFNCFRALVKKEADVNVRIYTGHSALHLAAEKGCVHAVSLLLQHGADIDVYTDHNLSPLFLACHKGRFDCVKLLLKVANERGLSHLVNAPAEDNATPLLIAAQEGHADIVDFLLRHGADADATILVDDYVCNSLQYAVYFGRTRCVELLLPYTDLTVFERYDKMHPLVQALKHHDTTILEMLHQHLDVHALSPVTRYVKSKLGHLTSALVPARVCSLLCLVQSEWPVAGAEFLLKQGVSPNTRRDNRLAGCEGEGAARGRERDREGEEEELPPLIVALWTNNVPYFQLLLRYKANPNFYHKNVTGNVAMLLAFQNDLERDLSATIVRNSRQPNFQIFYIWQLFLAGAESHSLFDLDMLKGQGSGVEGSSSFTSPSPAITNLFGLKFHMFKRKENLVPVLALLMCISDHASLPSYVLSDSDLDSDQRKVLLTISEKTNSLSHRCRRMVVHQLGKENCYCRSSMEKLRIPSVLQDYLMFSELETPLQDMILKFITVSPTHLDDAGDS